MNAVCDELKQREEYLKEEVETIYFGGGTPSLLSSGDFKTIFEAIYSNYRLKADQREITLEANPDDLSPEYLDSLRPLPFNRLSLGIQSLDDKELCFLNRRHDAAAALQAVENAQKAGFENISIDLIYGLPDQDLKSWKKTLRQVCGLGIQHISAYHLTYEEGTSLYRLWETGKVGAPDEDLSLRLFEVLIETLEINGFDQYEISNFAQPGFHSRHNLSYWEGKPYLGIGAAAHSYNGTSRSWNGSRLDYLETEREIEEINEETAYNEFIITRLRTKRGIDTNELEGLFGEERLLLFLKKTAKYFQAGLLENESERIRFTRKGLFISDGIMSELMI